MRIDLVALFALLIAVIGLGLGQIWPEWTAFCVLLAAILLASTTRSLFHPALVLMIALTFILLLGGLNISNYRGQVSSSVFSYILTCILTLSGTAALAVIFPPGPRRRAPKLPVLHYWGIIASMLPALIGVAMIVTTVGVPLFNPSARFRADPKALFFAETATAAGALMAYRYLINRRWSGIDWFLAAIVGILLLIPGYRNWIVVAILVGMIGLVRSGAIRIRPVPAVLFLATAMTFLGAVSEFRRAVSPELLSADVSLDKYQVQYLPGFLAQLHFGFRESIALTGQLIERPYDMHGQDAFFADVLTMLPGQRASGGQIIGQVFGSVLAGGLTPGMVGMLTLEFGRTWCLAAFAVCGLMIGGLWRWYARTQAPEIAFVYGFFVVNFLLLFHRGILKPGMLAVPLYFISLVALFKLLRRRPEQHQTERGSEQSPPLLRDSPQ